MKATTLILEAKPRELTGRAVMKLRQEGLVPAVLYGHGIKNQNLQVGYPEMKKIYSQAGESSLVDLDISGKKIKVLIQDVQFDPVRDEIIHVDFREVKMTEKIITEVHLKFIGESKAIKELAGIMVKPLDKVKVECLPQDLIHEIEVDISSLNTFADVIRVRDLGVPDKVKILEKAEAAVVMVKPPRSEEELKALETKVEEKVEEVKVETEEKKKEKEAAEKAEAGEAAEEKKKK